MKKYSSIAILSIIVTAALFFYQFILHGLLPIPSDTIVGLYHPFSDIYSTSNPNGVPYKNFLITDPVRQQYPWRSLVVDLEKHLQLPLWNPYTFAGYPLLANFQSAALYPLNILFFLLPFQISWSILIVLEPLLGGLFLYLYLRNLTLDPLASLFGAVTFMYSGFFVAWLEWNTIIHVAIWLPLILLAKDKLLKKWSVRWAIIFLFSEIAAFLAGHLQILFYAICVSNAYLAVRIYQKAQQKSSNTKIVISMIKIYVPFLFAGLAILVITSVQWLPTLQVIVQSGRNIDQVNNWQKDGWFIPWQHLLQFLVPDFFGNPSTLNYWGVWNYGELIGYVGTAPLLLVLFAMFFRKDKKTLFFGSIFFLSLIFSLPTFFAKIPFQLSLPFISTSQPTRLLFITDFSLAILSALGFDYFLKTRKGFLYPVIFLALFFIGLWMIVFMNKQVHILSPENYTVAKNNLVFPTIFFGVMIIFYGAILFFKPHRKTIYVLILAVTLVELMRFSWKFTPFTPTQYLFPNTKSITFLQKNIGNNRFMTTDERIFPPNFSVIYKLQSIDGYDPLYLQTYGELIAASQRGKPDISGPLGFNRIITPHDYTSPIINILGVKYILSLTTISAPNYQLVFREGQTMIYENKNSFDRAFLVENVIRVADKQQAIRTMFDKRIDLKKTAIVTCLQCGELTPINKHGSGTSMILHYSPNEVSISTDTGNDMFLVLTDSYYPTWHAKIDGKETRIYNTDYNFRGVLLPRGRHEVTFYVSLI